jgi:hypothetical protein
MRCVSHDAVCVERVEKGYGDGSERIDDMGDDKRPTAGGASESQSNRAAAEREHHSDVASGGSGTTEWSGGEVTTGRAGIVDPDAGDVPPNEARNDVRDPDKAYGADSGMAEKP